MGPIARELAANEARLTAAWGDTIPQLSEAVLASAERATEKRLAGAAVIRPVGGSDWTQGVSVGLLPNLAAAYRHKRDGRFALTARAFYEHWLEVEPGDRGWKPPEDYNALIIPHRLGDTEVVGWFGALPEFLSSSAFDEALLARIVESARVQLNHLATHLHEARNIRMSQCDALLTEGLRLAFLPDAAMWRRLGLMGLNDCFHRQFNPDGSSIEATGWYHFICVNMALRFWRLGRAMPELGLQANADLIAKGLDYTVAMVQPDGKSTLIGDCTSWICAEGTLQAMLDRRTAARRELGVADPGAGAPPPLSQVFPGAKQVMLRDGWGPDAMYVTFDATRRSGYHWHAARNAIQVFLRGRRVIADPGRMTYSNTPQRAYAVTTNAHSTMNVNGWNQSDADPMLRCHAVEGYDIVEGRYDGGYWQARDDGGYDDGIYATHHRVLLWVHGRFLLVLDNLYNTATEGNKPTVICNWQMAPGVAVSSVSETGALAAAGDARLQMLFALKPADMRVSLHEGELNPCLGWAADHGDKPAAAPLLSLRVANYDPWNTDLATVIVPLTPGVAPSAVVRTAIDPGKGGYGHITVAWSDGSSDEFWWTRRMHKALNNVGALDSDAGLVHLRRTPDGKLAQGAVYEGTYLGDCRPRHRTAQTFVVRPA